MLGPPGAPTPGLPPLAVLHRSTAANGHANPGPEHESGPHSRRLPSSASRRRGQDTARPSPALKRQIGGAQGHSRAFRAAVRQVVPPATWLDGVRSVRVGAATCTTARLRGPDARRRAHAAECLAPRPDGGRPFAVRCATLHAARRMQAYVAQGLGGAPPNRRAPRPHAARTTRQRVRPAWTLAAIPGARLQLLACA